MCLFRPPWQANGSDAERLEQAVFAAHAPADRLGSPKNTQTQSKKKTWKHKKDLVLSVLALVLSVLFFFFFFSLCAHVLLIYVSRCLLPYSAYKSIRAVNVSSAHSSVCPVSFVFFGPHTDRRTGPRSCSARLPFPTNRASVRPRRLQPNLGTALKDFC